MDSDTEYCTCIIKYIRNRKHVYILLNSNCFWKCMFNAYEKFSLIIYVLSNLYSVIQWLSDSWILVDIHGINNFFFSAKRTLFTGFEYFAFYGFFSTHLFSFVLWDIWYHIKNYKNISPDLLWKILSLLKID